MSPTNAKAKAAADAGPPDESLKRLGGGRWQTRDDRFTIEPQSGTWSVVDAEETDDFGLPLVRGPFKSLADAKEAIAAARAGGASPSPLAARLDGRAPSSPGPKVARGAGTTVAAAASAPAPATRSESKRPKPKAATPTADDEPREPGWFRDLDPADRGRARRLIDRLGADGVADAESIVRRDLAGGVPALAAHAIAAQLATMGSDADAADVARLLAEGRDQSLGVRWRLVDGEGRPITLDPQAGKRRR